MRRREGDRSLIDKVAQWCLRFKIPVITFFAIVALAAHVHKVGIGRLSNGTTATPSIVVGFQHRNSRLRSLPSERSQWDQPHDIAFQTYGVHSPQGISMCGSEENLDSSCDNACGEVAPLLNHLATHGNNTAKPELYFAPLDGIALLRSSNFSAYEEALRKTLDSVYNGYSFMRLGGASHVLLCLVDGCEHVMTDVVKSHAIGKKSRVIWVGGGHIEGKDQWACPDRVVIVPDSLAQALRPADCKVDGNRLWMGVHELLSILNIMFSGKNIWQCGREKWDLELGNASLSAQLVVDREHKLAICPIPKCGTTRLKMLLRRMTNQPNWDSFDGNIIHFQNGLEVVQGKQKVLELFQDPSWIKVAFVRHPAERFLSGYLNKIKHAKWYNIIDPKQTTEPSMQQAIDSLMKASKSDRFKDIDSHFKGLQFFCGFKYVRYDFLGKTPTMGKDLQDLLASLALWEKYGASGWGKNKSMSIVEASVYRAPNHSESKVDQMLSDKMLHQLFSIFHQDYELLDFKALDVGG